MRWGSFFLTPVRRIWWSDRTRKTRFHSEAGKLPPLTAWAQFPRALWYFAVRKTDWGWRGPWMVFDAVRALNGILTPTSQVLEVGAGQSTVWLAQRVAHVVSLETNPTWYETIKRRLAQQALSNVTLILVDKNDLVRHILALGIEFDVVLIDGPDPRLPQVRASLLQLRSGGYLILDNSDRPRYEAVFTDLAVFPCRRITGFLPGSIHVCETAIWRVDRAR